MKIKFNDGTTWYDIRPGAVFTDNYNETIDTASIFIDHLTTQISLQPLDFVELDNGKYYCVNDYTERIISFEPMIYQYEINIISLTKHLECVLLPSRSITKLPYDGTVGVDIEKETIYPVAFLEGLEVGDVIYEDVSTLSFNVSAITGVTITNITYTDMFDIKEWYFYNHTLRVYLIVKNKPTTISSAGGVKIVANNLTFGLVGPVSIKEKIEQFLKLYSPKIKNGSSYLPLFALEDNEQLYFECPEFQWTTPTLREALNDLCMTRDCIPYIENKNTNGQFVIKLKNISIIGSDVTDKTKINYIETGQSIDNYVSSLVVDVKNIVSHKIHTIDELFYRNSSKYVMSDQDYELMTQLPIWKIVSLRASIVKTGYKVIWNEAGGPRTSEVTTAYPRYIDLTQFVLEQSVWNTKSVLYQTLPDYPSAAYQNTSLYYIRGSKGIFNFSASANRQIVFSVSRPVYKMIQKYVNDTALQQIIDSYQAYYPAGYGFQASWIQNGSSVVAGDLDITYELTYIPCTTLKMDINNSLLNRNFKQTVDNQSTQLADIDKLISLEQQKVNRLGNKMSIINARYNLTDTIPALSQTINDKVIFKRDIAYYNDYAIVNFYATENYVLKDYFTGVKSKIREWKIADASEAVERNEVFKFYINSTIPDFIDSANYIMGQYAPNPYYVLVRFNRDIWYRMEFTRIVKGNSTFIHFEFADNATIQKRITNRSGTGGMEQQDYYYTDTSGNADLVDIMFGPSDLITQITQYTTMADMIERQNRFPFIADSLIDESRCSFKRRIYIYKDNREKLSFTLQFEYNENANDMFIGRN